MNHHITHPIHIIGLELRTSNDNGRSLTEIPPFWERFMAENRISQIPSPLSADLYAVYTHFENEGKNNTGLYSMIIGCAVSSDTLPPDGFTKVTIPPGNYRVFPVKPATPEQVGRVWQEIWAIPQDEKHNWSFRCEFDHYHASGEIDVFIGQR